MSDRRRPSNTPDAPPAAGHLLPQDERKAIPFAAIANYTYDWETWVDPDGKPRWVNPAVERITGYTPGACLAMDSYPLPLVHEDDRSTIRACLAAASRGESGNDIEFRILHRSGQERWGAVSWQSVVDEDGTRIGWRTSVRDITDRKQIEAELRKAHADAAKANHAKSKFLAAASHDLRQPVQAVSMFVAALRSAKDADARREILKSIEESLQATDDLLNALLDVSRLDAGVFQPKVRAFAIGDLLDRLEREYAARATAKGLKIRSVISSAFVLGDPVLVERILRNLVSNAIRYTEQGRILIGCRGRGESLAVEVYDTGIGISAEDIPLIFEEFRQLGNPERDRTKGLGLGLAIVDRLSKLLGLKPYVRSTPGQGSLFGFTLPRASKTDLSFAKEETALAEGLMEGRKVLVIDDDPAQLRALEALLSQWGCNVVTAETGDEAVIRAKMQQRPPDLVIADHRLREEKTGSEAVALLRGRLARPLPAILLTGDTEASRLQQAAGSGLTLLHKPVRPESLYRELVALTAETI